MSKILRKTSTKKPGDPKKPLVVATLIDLPHLAFDNSIQPNVISTVSTGKIVMANGAARKLLGYSKKSILTKNRSTIFASKEISFKKMLKQRSSEGHSSALVTAIKKNGKSFPCEITSAIFSDELGIEKSITTLTDMSQSILKQQLIDILKEKIVADDIIIAKTKQKEIDVKKEKIVADDIIIAETKQKKIDIKKEKIVADDIIIAKTKQKKIDIKKEKIVADDIIIAETKQKKIDIKKEKIVADDIIIAETKQKKIDIKKEKIVADDIIIAETKQKKIDIKKEKIVAGDIKEAKAKSDARLAEHAEWKKYIGKTLYDVMWDWDVLTGEIYVGDSMEELFGYQMQSNRVDFSDFLRCLLPKEKVSFKKRLAKALATVDDSWNDSFKVKRRDRSMASTISRASIIRDDLGKAIRLIGAIQDVTEVQELEKKLDDQYAIKWERSVISNLAAKLSYDGIWDWNILTNKFFLGEGFQELFGYAFNKADGPVFRWGDYLHPDNKETVEKALDTAIASTAMHWEQACRFIRADGSIAEVFARASILRQPDGKAYRMIGAMHDVSKQKVLEERLEREIKLKEIQIANASEEAKDAERSDLGKELHDNVNQLLGASRQYLEMAKKGGVNTELYLSRSSEYILTAIEEIRKLAKGMTTDIINNLGLCEAIINIMKDTMEVNPIKVSCELSNFSEDGATNKFKLNIFRIVQEQMNNILKYASATEVVIRLSQNKKSIILCITDNGIGFDTNRKHDGIGIDNIKSRAASFNGTADFVSKPGHGCALTVTFPPQKSQ